MAKGKSLVKNCTAKVEATEEDVVEGDNTFKCPFVGKFVVLGKENGRIVCLDECDYRSSKELEAFGYKEND